ncbi:aldehyde dehydrogenase family protein [Vibrio algarum]|uniref:Aldehyde dehydrogenase family protein n=1 Tax=Vibrio algarum TaxID=3020714 RepID=A0ABT4YUK2_9VIBR|nr:aldehyde dehydrogenase family protein [Vibrio sp. KJ40-1]MDB1125262.1 aldehyde dehydrogenase family protein [Vibrio sp. KJ40-1]
MDSNELESIVRNILSEKLAQNAPVESPAATENALFESVDSAIQAASSAFQRFHKSPLKTRSAIITAIRKELAPIIPKLAADAVAESGMGNTEHKILKNQAALNNTPGIEDLTTQALTGDDGMVLYEYSPYGVIGSITPSTNPTETIINNSISMLAAGNTVYFSLTQELSSSRYG